MYAGIHCFSTCILKGPTDRSTSSTLISTSLTSSLGAALAEAVDVAVDVVVIVQTEASVLTVASVRSVLIARSEAAPRVAAV